LPEIPIELNIMVEFAGFAVCHLPKSVMLSGILTSHTHTHPSGVGRKSRGRVIGRFVPVNSPRLSLNSPSPTALSSSNLFFFPNPKKLGGRKWRICGSSKSISLSNEEWKRRDCIWNQLRIFWWVSLGKARLHRQTSQYPITEKSTLPQQHTNYKPSASTGPCGGKEESVIPALTFFSSTGSLTTARFDC